MSSAIHKVFFLVSIVILTLYGCSSEDIEYSQENRVAVRIELDGGQTNTRALGDATLSVNRILILPFKKINESATNDATNFIVDYSAAKQLDINSFPAIVTMLNLSSSSTYQLLILGYNRTDFDFTNQGIASQKFSIGPSASATLASFYLQPTSVPDVTEFFSCSGYGYQGSTLVGTTFKPGNINNIKGTLKRLVSGFSIEVSNVPAFVTSMTLVAEQLVTSIKGADGTPLTWQTPGSDVSRSFGAQPPLLGKVAYNKFMLPTQDARKTLFYLDVLIYGVTQRYTVKVPDLSGASSGNRFIFTPNQWIKVTGDYSKLNIGFQITGVINLDDNNWDGLQ